MLIDICMKFLKDSLNGFQVIERTQFCDRQMDRCSGKNNMSPNPEVGGGGGGGDINYSNQCSLRTVCFGYAHFYCLFLNILELEK